MADRVSARRERANALFVAVNASLATLHAGLSETVTGVAGDVWPYVIPVVGALSCVLWWALLRSYRTLNSAKFATLQEMEERLPAQPFTDEWDRLGRGEVLGRHIQLTRIEQIVPGVFVILYLALALALAI